jgi:hypothetical protein
VLLEPANTQLAIAITPDGRRLLYAERKTTEGTGHFDLLVTDLATGGAGKPYATSSFSEYRGTFSPDGRWLAYQSNESGRSEVYVQAFPEPGRKWQVSTQGGGSPSWTRGGGQLFYVAADRKLMRVDARTAPSFDAGIPEALFTVPLAALQARNLFVFSPDDQRILAVSTGGTGAATPTTVALNWSAAFRK